MASERTMYFTLLLVVISIARTAQQSSLTKVLRSQLGIVLVDKWIITQEELLSKIEEIRREIPKVTS